MNKDEIKEKLNYFRKYNTFRENTMISEIEVYIDNLREENEKLIKEIEKQKDTKAFWHIKNDLKKEKIEELQQRIQELEEVFTSRGFTNIEQMATMFDYYKSRIDKAIEYIENSEKFEIEIFSDATGGCLGTNLSDGAKELLKILKGEENEQ